MADSLGNLSLSDMPWLGKPADPMGSLQAGQNFAAKRQAMQQSREMFPLKKEAARADIDYRVQATASAKGAESRAAEMQPLKLEGMTQTNNLLRLQSEYNTKTMDSRVGLADSLSELQATAAWVADKSKEADVDNKIATARVKSVEATIKEATQASAIDAQRAVNQGEVLTHKINLLKQHDDVRRFNAETNSAVAKAEFDKRDLNNKIIQSNLVTNKMKMADVIGANMLIRHQRQFDAEDRGLPALETYRDKMWAYNLTGHYDLMDNMVFEGVTEQQRQELVNLRTHYRSSKAFTDHEQAVKNQEARLQAQRTGQTKAIGALGDVAEKLFIGQDGIANGFLNSDGTETTAKGVEAIQNLTEYNKMAKAFTPDELHQFGMLDPNTGASVSKRLGHPAGDHIGDTFIPNKDALRKMREAFNAKKAASTAGVIKTELSGEDYFGNKWKGTTEQGAKLEQFNDSLTQSVALFNAARKSADEAGEEFNPMRAWADVVKQVDVLEGEITPVLSGADASKLAPGTKFFNLNTGQIGIVNQPGAPGAPVGGTPGTPGGGTATIPGTSSLEVGGAEWANVIADVAATGMTSREADIIVSFAAREGIWNEAKSSVDNLRIVKSNLEEQGRIINRRLSKMTGSFPLGDLALTQKYKHLEPYFGKLPSQWPDKIGPFTIKSKAREDIEKLESDLKRWKGYQATLGTINKALK